MQTYAMAPVHFCCLAIMMGASAQAAIVTSHISELVPFQERCDASDSTSGCGGDADAGEAKTTEVLSFLEVNGKGFQTTCDWTVYYDQWVPTFEPGEYEHPWNGGFHCLEACCRDPKCNSLQLLSDELYQCYKYNKPPVIRGAKEGQLLGDAKWLLSKKKAWSVFVKGHPSEVAARLAATSALGPVSVAQPFPNIANSGQIDYASVSSADAFTWLSRIGVMVVLAALVMRIMSETTIKAVAKMKFGADANEKLSLLK